MQFETVNTVVGSPAFLQLGHSVPALPLFDSRAIELLDALSHRLRQLPEAKEYPDIAALAFWCRRGHISKLAEEYTGELRLGKGMAFHVAPSNVPLQFMYTLMAGLLSGCANAVRLPSREFPQAGLVCGALNELLHTDYTELLPYVFCFRCSHEHPVLLELSKNCDVCVIWGGNETIAQLRRLPRKPRATELPFADRYSICAIRADAFLHSDEQQSIAERFCQDAYFSGQWACTAPRLVFWLGEPEQCRAARTIFWGHVEAIARQKYPVSAVQAIKKREQFCLLAAKFPQVQLCPGENHAVRIEVPSLSESMMEYWTGEGLFLECSDPQLQALLPVLTERCQTVTCFGVEKQQWREFLLQSRPKGIDRITPFGSSMQFSLQWDGIDLVRSMSRSICML